jgi:hypothetical protein
MKFKKEINNFNNKILNKNKNKIRSFLTGKHRLSSNKRIGLHNIDIILIIIGSALGDSHLEKRK